MRRLSTIAHALWNYLREVSGENDHARYCQRELARGHAPMTAQEFYLGKIQRQYSRISRCC